MEDYSFSQVRPGVENYSMSGNPENLETRELNSYGIRSDLFYGYTWPGWITMAISFLGASANIFHVGY